MKVVLATNNPGKVREIREILAPRGIEVVSLSEYPGLAEIKEGGDTFKDNAAIKALAACEHTNLVALADDSGLEVDCLDGAPGVYSSRFAGEEKDDAANNRRLLELLASVPEKERTARFRCVVAIVDREGWIYNAEGTCEGIIAMEPRGEGGFGYDPLFYLPEYGKTFAELEPEIKNKISHRARALAGALDILSELERMKDEEE
ncbi:MAG TPA: non-canonical purine NTP pyrophosphatase [Armatimonadetes bacterium]|nr:non-canonical purine NTP pyrophosphatase [Armatimonadota bacterium]